MAQDLEARVRAALREVLREMGLLLPKPPAPAGPRVLFVVHGGSPAQNLALEQIAAIQDLAGKSSVYLSGAARLCMDSEEVREQTGARCLLGDVTPDELDRVLARADWLVVPTLPLNLAARAAQLGAVDYCPIQEALLRGKQVLAARDAFRHAGVMPRPALEESIAQVLATLESWGVILAPVARLAQVFESKVRPPAPAAPAAPAPAPAAPAPAPAPEEPALAYVSARDVRRAADEGRKLLRVKPGGLVGPLARDLARDNGIEIKMNS
ncbi:MAG: hypothetical protein KQJ78_04155 [Deltaproteobacteria bacterium]|nr:hypothetical protein [Deltaproteobacteria bacterium]